MSSFSPLSFIIAKRKWKSINVCATWYYRFSDQRVRVRMYLIYAITETLHKNLRIGRKKSFDIWSDASTSPPMIIMEQSNKSRWYEVCCKIVIKAWKFDSLICFLVFSRKNCPEKIFLQFLKSIFALSPEILPFRHFFVRFFQFFWKFFFVIIDTIFSFSLEIPPGRNYFVTFR